MLSGIGGLDLAAELANLAGKAQKDETFWKHIDDVVVGELKQPFDRENYERMNR